MAIRSLDRVLIAGGGPIGMVSGLLLAHYGIASTIFEKRRSLSGSPQAHVLKQRSMEILRELGLEAEVRTRSTPPEEMRYINWVDTLAGPEIARLDIWKFSELLAQVAEGSPSMPGNLAQNLFEQILLDRVRREPLIELRPDCEVMAIEQTAEAVTVTLRDDSAGQTFQSGSYLIACDGASSATRDRLGIGMEGPDKLATVVMIHFEADLSRFMKDRPGVLFWNLDPDNGGNFIVYDMRHTHVYMHPYDDVRDSYDRFTPDRAEAIVRRAIGVDDIALKIVSVRPWIMRSQVATAYRKGRVFLAGDAAHRFPPTGGLGMNTGIGEAYNLCWKLAAVLKGWGGEALLDSYEAECRPLAEANAAHSLDNSMKMFEVLTALGLTGDKKTDKAILASFGKRDGVPTARRRAIDDAVDAQIAHFLTVGLDLGARHRSPILPEDQATQPDSTALRFHPATRPGMRLPHIWLDTAARRSSHDVISGQALTLVTRTIEKGAHLAIREAADFVSLPLQIVELGDDFAQISDTEGLDALLVRPDKCIAWRGHLFMAGPPRHLMDVMCRAVGIDKETRNWGSV